MKTFTLCISLTFILIFPFDSEDKIKLKGILYSDNRPVEITIENEKIKEIRENKSDIRAYGGTNHEEFLAVTSEYFFERPKLLEKKHPVLYEYMEMMFGQELADQKLVKKAKPTQHWDPCPCESGRKFRNCCNLA